MADYLRNDALHDTEERIQETRVFVDEPGNKLIAYYTTSMTAIENKVVSGGGLSKMKYPALFFNNLSVDCAYVGAGRKLGTRIFHALLKEAACHMSPAPRFLYGEAYLERVSFYIGEMWDEIQPVVSPTGLRNRIILAVGGELLKKMSSNDVENETEQQAFFEAVVDSSPLLQECHSRFFITNPGVSYPIVGLDNFGQDKNSMSLIQERVRAKPVSICNKPGFFLQDVGVPFLFDLKKAQRCFDWDSAPRVQGMPIRT